MTDTGTKEKTNEKAVSIKLPVRRLDGTATGEEIELDNRVFGLDRNDHVLYLAVKTEMKNRRQGSRSVKGRSEVRGGGKKPWRQKGRGAGRVGTIRSPLWRGGGVIFGPTPQNFSMKLPRKVKQLARRIAFSVKARSDSIQLVEDFSFDSPKTKRISDMVKCLNSSKKSVLILTEKNLPEVVKSCRNIPRIETRECLNASTMDILRARQVIITKTALHEIVGGLSGA